MTSKKSANNSGVEKSLNKISPESGAKPGGAYHHGNLKQTLVSAYLELLLDIPLEKLSLRKLASHVGVAPTAVYNHFAEKEMLIVAVKVQCLEHFARYLESALSETDTPQEKIMKLGRSYYLYSVEHQQYFNFVFQVVVPDQYITEEMLSASMQAESKLREVVIELLESNGLPTSQYNEGLGAFVCWALAHGVSALAAKHVNHAACLEGRWPPEFMLSDPDSVSKSFEALADVIVSGILARASKVQ